MKQYNTLVRLIERIRGDYQFDPSHELYHGYINMDPSQDWSIEEYNAFSYYFYQERNELDELLWSYGLELDQFISDECIISLREDATEMKWDRNLWQGRSQKQIEYTEKAIEYSLISISVIVIAYFIWNSIH
jgi:hypothetical protein